MPIDTDDWAGNSNAIPDSDETDCLENPSHTGEFVVTQQCIRSVSDQEESIACQYLVKFSPRQNRRVIHIPFVPSLKEIPQVHAFVSDYEDVRIRITDCQKYGLRAEVILPAEPDATCLRLVEFVISAKNPQGAIGTEVP